MDAALAYVGEGEADDDSVVVVPRGAGDGRGADGAAVGARQRGRQTQLDQGAGLWRLVVGVEPAG